MFENHRKSLIQLYERSELRLNFEWTKLLKVIKNAKSDFEYLKLALLPDRSILIGQKLVEIAKIEKLKCDILGDF